MWLNPLEPHTPCGVLITTEDAYVLGVNLLVCTNPQSRLTRLYLHWYSTASFICQLEFCFSSEKSVLLTRCIQCCTFTANIIIMHFFIGLAAKTLAFQFVQLIQ